MNREPEEPNAGRTGGAGVDRGGRASAAVVRLVGVGNLLPGQPAICAWFPLFLGRHEPQFDRARELRLIGLRSVTALPLDENVAGRFRRAAQRATGRPAGAGVDGRAVRPDCADPKHPSAVRTFPRGIVVAHTDSVRLGLWLLSERDRARRGRWRLSKEGFQSSTEAGVSLA